MQRSFKVDADKKEKKLVGYAIKFNDLGKIIEGDHIRYERITKSALDEADFSSAVLRVDHDDNKILARVSDGTLKLVVDDIGLWVEAIIGDDEFSQDIYKKVKNGIIDQMSFAAICEEEELVDEDGVPVFLLKKLGKFEDVSLVEIPAYRTTEMYARSQEGGKKMEENKKVENQNEEKIDENVIKKTKEDVVEDIQDKANENGIDYEKLAKEIAKQIQPKKEEKEDKAKEVEKETEKVEVEKGGIERNMVDVNKLKRNAVDVRSTDEYKAAWIRGVKSGSFNEAKDMVIRAGIATNSGMGADKLIPTDLSDYIETELREGGRIASLCNIKTVKGALSLVVEKTATDAVIHTEGSAAPAEEEITMGQILINPEYLKKWISVTDFAMSMSDVDLADYVINELKNKILEKLDELILNGDGKVKGILKNSDELFVKKLEDEDKKGLVSIGYKAQGYIKTATTPKVVMNRMFYYSVLATLQNTQGDLQLAGMMTDALGNPMFNGMQVVFTDGDILAKSLEENKPAMIIGDFKNGYTLNCPNGSAVEVMMDEKTEARKNLVLFIGKLLAGGDVTKLHSFVTVKFKQGE